LRAALSIWRFPQTTEALAQAVSSLAPIAPIRNGRRTGGRPVERADAGLSGTGQVERTALEVVSNRDRTKIVASAQSALGLIRGKWKIWILIQLIDRPVRLGQLRRLIPGVSKKVLVQQLHELEKDGIIVRTDLSGKVKRVEYTISAPLGKAVVDLLGLLSDWGMQRAPAMALHCGTRIGTTPVLPMPAKSALNI
jgi:DNA-binding HxlR family transcriptional regulator